MRGARRRCYALADDSEFCVYEGPVCTAGAAQLVALSSSPLATLQYADADGRGLATCADGRNFEQRENCTPSVWPLGRGSEPEPWGSGGGALDAVGVWAAAAAGGPALPSAPTGTGRSWGPLGRNAPFGHVPPAWVARATTAAALHAVGAPELVPGLAAAREDVATRAAPAVATAALAGPPATVAWLPTPAGAAVYWAALSDDGFKHPWHLAIATLQLWAVRRLNASAAAVPAYEGGGGGGGARPFMLSSGAPGGGGALPPVAQLSLLSTAPLPHISARRAADLSPWAAATLRLAAPPGAEVLLPVDSAARFGAAGASHWQCAARAVVLGEKTRLFTGAGDAHAWRRTAYAAAALPAAAAWPALPPRTITLIVRYWSRGFTNAAALRRLLAATGLPLRLLALDGPHGERDWAAQVRAFAGTGILVAAHGAALANVPYLPPHAALIEVFPYLGTVPVFRRVAEAARVAYHPVRARAPSAAAIASGLPGVDLWNSSEYAEACERSRRSSADAPLLPACSVAMRNAYFEAPLEDIAAALDHALDDISCRHSVCLEADGSFADFRPRAAAAVAEQAALGDGDGVVAA